ncbi:M23 family metallopeptidase [Pontibacter roseus]|uniref:M23 family metallopeptidase n=1 Tax=Pontibacter roseus TaxID=336989 RepID=UPI000524CF39|nr:M23 family metallopeptidase [Pontibacter roseus]
MKLNKRLALLIAYVFTTLGLAAQPAPESGYFMFPIKPGQRNYLSGSMGEIRATHFHGGLDIKTDQRVGLSVYAAADGYISRVKASTYGYGNIIYITHPNGLTTTYSHLLSFYDPLADYVLQKQYEKETFELELFPEKNLFPVKKGQIIALSGNTGGSGGPHLHFEIRDAEDRLYNPLRWGFKEIIDTTPPDIFGLAIRPFNIHARVNQEFAWQDFKPVKTNGAHIYTLPDTVYAHGLIGFELQTSDRYDGADNRNGTQEVTVYVNNRQVYNHHIDRVPFEKSKQVSQHINYNAFRRMNRNFQKAYVDYGNDLPLYTAAHNRGRLNVHADSTYQIRLEAKDSHNNISNLIFLVKGQKPVFTQTLDKTVKKPNLSYEVMGNILKVSATDTSATPRNVELEVGNQRFSLVPSYTKNSTSVSLYDLRGGLPQSISFCGTTTPFNFQAVVPPGQEYNFTSRDMTILFDKETLYDTLYLQARKDGDIYTIGDYFTPLHKAMKVTITPDTKITDKTKAAVYYLGTGRGRGLAGGAWDGNSITFTARGMGKFKVMEDLKPPVVKLLSKNKDQVKFKISDDLSGINSFRCEVNGKWLLMKYEHKNATIYSEKLDKSIPLSGKVVLKVKDNAGNEAVYNTTI